MDVAALQAYCVGKPGAWTDFPWDHDFPVVKVGEGERGKIFAFLGADTVGVKGGATREVADEWLDRYPDAATVMRYIGRSGWNSLAYAGIPDDDAARGGRRVLPARRREDAQARPAGRVGRGAEPGPPVWNGGADRGVLARNDAWRAHDVTVDGDTTETSETRETTDPTARRSRRPTRSIRNRSLPQAEGVSAEQLCDYVERANFATTLGRRGYQQGEVDALLVRVTETLRAGEPLADLVRNTHLTHVRLEDGYDHTQVDDFLAAVVDLDPHADARPEVARGGLISKLFG